MKISDREDARLQEAYDEAASRVDPVRRPVHNRPIEVAEVAPAQEPRSFVLTEEELLAVKDESQAWAEWQRTLTDLRAYRSSKETNNNG